MPRRSLPLPGELRSTWDLHLMNIENYGAVTVPLSARLPLAFRWLVEDAECAMGLVRGAQGHEWGDLFFCSGGLRPGNTIYRLMAAWMTSRQIPVPGWLRPVVEGAHEPAVPPKQPGAYGNAAVAQVTQSVEAAAHCWCSSNTSS